MKAILLNAESTPAKGRHEGTLAGALPQGSFGSIASVWPSVADFRSSPGSGHRHGRSACLKSANARNRCAIARCAGSPTASAVTGGKIVKTQNRCEHSSVEAVRLVCEHGGHG